MRQPRRLRKWGIPVGTLWTTPGRGATPAAVVAEMPDPDGPPVESSDAVVVERLDVEPELRPWDTAQSPPRDPPPKPDVRPEAVPHCDGRHGIRRDGERCEWCDALTDMATRVRRLERDAAEKDRRIAALEERLSALDGVAR